MNSATGSFIRFSTDQFSERDRVEAMREIFGRAIMKLEFEPLPDVSFKTDKTLFSLPDFGVSIGVSSPMNCIRPPQLIDSDDLILTVARTGRGTIHAHGRETEIGDGSASLVRSGEPHRFCIHTTSESITFRFKPDRIVPLIADFDAVLNKPIPATSEALRILLNYSTVLCDDNALATEDLRNLVSIHVQDLAALMFGATRDAAATAFKRGVPAARLRAIKADIVKNLANRQLSIEFIALRHGITPRYVGMLFEKETLTFSEFVLARRLNLARTMLTDARYAAHSVSSIAYGSGFGDLSYFNRVFRQQYGATPSEIRQLANR